MQNETESPRHVGSNALLGHGGKSEGCPNGWLRVVVMVSPDGRDAHAIGGDCAPGDGDTLYYGWEHVRKWLHAYNHPPLSWWRKDKHGWPIETFKGKPVKSAVRVICQNIRKVRG